MPRAKEFDIDLACEAAMELFWRQGYDATSITDLVAELGIAKASLYATFGAKHDLYLTALERYVERTNARIVADLSGAGPALSAVRRLVQRYVDEMLTDQDRMCCLVINAAIERLPDDTDVARLVERSWDTLEVSLTLALNRARAEGDLPPTSEPQALARFLLTFLQGLRVVGKGAAAEKRLRASVDVALKVLDSG